MPLSAVRVMRGHGEVNLWVSSSCELQAAQWVRMGQVSEIGRGCSQLRGGS